MRRRLLIVLLVFSVLAVAGFAVPLLASTAANRTYEFTMARTADAARFAALAQPALAGGSTDQLRAEVRAHADLFGDGVVVVDARRAVVVAEGMGAAEPDVAAAVDAALRNQPRPAPADLRPWSGGDVLVSHAVGTGVRVSGAVVLRTSVRPAVEDIAVRWALVLLASLVAAAAVVVVVFRVARWVLLPVDQLARAMHRMTEGREHPHVDVVAGPPELRGLAGEFNRMSDALAASAQAQRGLVADIAHQLRNPMAALRLRVDGLADGAVQRSMLTEFDRLEALLDGMLALASADSTATDLAASGADARCDAVTVIAERLDAWQAAATAAGVTMAGPPDPPTSLPVRCADGELAQVIDVILDNAVKHAGAGATIRWSGRARDGVVELELADDGPGVADAELPRLTERFWRGPAARATAGSGLGLAIAERLITARGGRFAVTTGGGLTVHIELPEAQA
ncbi:HAMP domain-containing sensor histidine kinase [Actinokineospora sp. UTMC 2448]|uniref:HAMP domain-containing sensor histidine kinase n=1 Tax=Actinokineospora sp. UTMC 2448 TaxID=2268449 RepID=UPI002164009C|nr:HAMP domain-containing sensor histidine kinase [Actinokineospora sp. UTMC 2448]UVS79261.1 Signal transduction histidine-protein kinase BaeS [Actinokineospora sp. UTMC 2448]